MDRLFTAFVSSTYLDLIHERKVVANSLLNASCVPLGMEFFPSTGTGQWSAILDAMEAADFCIFIIGGRYGSIDPVTQLSWTRREYREAVKLGKPRIALLHADISALDPVHRETKPKLKTALLDFRKELESNALCRYFRNDAELLTALHGSISALRDRSLIEGWIPAGRQPVQVQESDFDRSYESVEIEARVSKATAGSHNTSDMRYISRRVIRCNEEHGLHRLATEFTHDTESVVQFNASNQPTVRLQPDSIRSGQGSIRLLPPRKITGPAFVQDVKFDPPLVLNETAVVTIEAFLPAYRYCYAEDMLAATLNSPMGPRTFETLTREISYPTYLLRMRVFLPNELGCTPVGPKVGRLSWVDDAVSSRLVSDGSYREWRDVLEGVPGAFMELTVNKPRLNWRYRLGWQLPNRLAPLST